MVFCGSGSLRGAIPTKWDNVFNGQLEGILRRVTKFLFVLNVVNVFSIPIKLLINIGRWCLYNIPSGID